MLKRTLSIIGIGIVLLGFAGCHGNKKVNNPIAQLDSKQPDKILFDRALAAMKQNKFDVARLTLQTLINTYPDSEYVARAKLAIGDSWYAEGSSAALIQAENEYKDFITFFPNMPEAAEAQLKIANIHYKEMEKPDRDFTHAKRAEEEYRQLMIQFPDSSLVPQAKQRLLEVQQVLGEREFLIGKFYYMRQSWVASVARLQSLVDSYPLYSGVDEALLLLGSAYEHEADAYRASQIPEAIKGKMIKEADDHAAAAYDRILTRYPVMPRAADAKKQLAAMNRPIPTPTPEALAQNKKEEESRGEISMWGKMKSNLHKGPNVAEAVKTGEPTLVDPQQVSAPELLRNANKQMMDAVAEATKAAQGGGNVKLETVKPGTGAPRPNDPTPRSDNGAPADNNGIPELQPITDTSQSSTSDSTAAPPKQINEMDAQQATPAGQSSSSSSGSTAAAPSTTSQQAAAAPPSDSTSKPKKKTGLRKLVPF